MKILLLGGGGREHALAWKIRQSPLCSALYIAPGNAGTAALGTNLAISSQDFDQLRRFCVEERVDMVVVGPEEPLVRGVADSFRMDDTVSHIPVIGPSAAGARLEGSKAFAKAFMQRHGIPTAASREFDAQSFGDGLAYLADHPLPVVLKADGLAAGKGVLICTSREEATREFRAMLHEKKFGEAGARVVVEQFLQGIELSVFVLTDGQHYLILPEAKDYKRIGEGDTGLNTGGMGAVSPVPFADSAFMKKVEDRIIRPTIGGLRQEGIPYTGFIFFGLIAVEGEPMVIEYNCRLGDPETEVILPRMRNDLVDLLQATARGELAGRTLETDPRPACTVVAVSGGYPGDYRKGLPIEGLDREIPGVLVFQAGTRATAAGVVTDGGRVLTLTSFGQTLDEAVRKSVDAMGSIRFEGMNFRRDIGWEFRDPASGGKKS